MGSNGKSKGKIDDTFKKRIDELEETARKIADSFKNGYNEYRIWHTPKDVKNLLDVPSLDNPAFDRFKINELYAQICAQPGENSGTVGDVIAMKAQNDFLAVEERAFRLRHATYARCICMAHGRFDGHGKKGESVFSFVKTSIEAVIEASKVT